jgi:hypothetical protein
MYSTFTERPTLQELTSYLETMKAVVSGRIVLVNAPARVPVTFSKPALRRDYDALVAQFDPVNPRPPQFGPQSRRAKERRAIPTACHRGR